MAGRRGTVSTRQKPDGYSSFNYHNAATSETEIIKEKFDGIHKTQRAGDIDDYQGVGS